MIVLLLLAFAVGATAGALALAVRERRRGDRLSDEVERLQGENGMLERRDAESGLYNSRHFVETLTREIERARTYGRPVALALAFVDEVRLTDAYDADVVLRSVGNAIGASVRAVDVACRVGSSEFGVIMPETDSRAASVASERVLRALAKLRGSSGGTPRASIGIAACPAHAETFEELVERAGSALRSARRAARPDRSRPGTVTVSLAVWEDAAED